MPKEGMSGLRSKISGDLNAVGVCVEVDGARFSWLQYTTKSCRCTICWGREGREVRTIISSPMHAATQHEGISGRTMMDVR